MIQDCDLDLGFVSAVFVGSGDRIRASIATQGAFHMELGHIIRVVDLDSISTVQSFAFESPFHFWRWFSRNRDIQVEWLTSSDLDLVNGAAVDLRAD